MTHATIPASDRPHKAAKRYIYAWGDGTAEGNSSMRDLLGGKGAGLAEMTKAGLPTPPGFTITTEACNDYFEAGERLPDGLWEDVLEAVKETERRAGKGFGDPANPLLVSVRSGAKFSMPGMMDTVLNLGLNEATLDGLVALTGNERFGWDAYRRFVAMFGRIVMGVDGRKFDDPLQAAKTARGVKADSDLPADDLKALVDVFKGVVRAETGRDFPTDPYEQLDLAIKAVFASWFGERAAEYRKYNKIPHDLGTAVNVVTMVFGNMGDDSGTGVAFTRNTFDGTKELYGEYLTNAQGEDVVAGIRTPKDISHLKEDLPQAYEEFLRIGEQLERHYRDVQDLEFTIERGRLWMLQTRSAKRTAAAAVTIAVQMVDEGLITKEEAIHRVEPSQVDQLLRPQFDDKARKGASVIASGLNASPGAAVGRAVFHYRDAVDWAGRGERVILVREETSPDDFPGMAVAEGILTAKGGATSHAAIVARQIGKPCVAGSEELHVDADAKHARSTVTGLEIHEGDWISLDGSSGDVLQGELPTVEARYEDQTDLKTILSWADEVRRMGVWTNADKPEEAAQARSYGAEGIGLCRTEHMFREGDRLEIVRGAILVATQATRAKAKAAAGHAARCRGDGRGRALRRGDGQARSAPAGRLRGHLQGDGRPAGRRPPDRPAAPRVPAQPRRPHRIGRDVRGAADTQGRPGVRRGPHAADGGDGDARAEPDAGAARLPARPDDPGLREDPDPGHPQRADRGQEGRRQPDRQDHDPARRARERARRDARPPGSRSRCHRATRGRHRGLQVRDDDRGAARRPDRRRDRPRGGFLQLRHERSDPDDVRVQPRRCRGRVPPQVRRGQDPAREPVPDAR